MSRIDRKTLKQPDAFQRESRHLAALLGRHWPAAAGALVVVAALVAGGLYWRAAAERRQAEASAALGAAVLAFDGGADAAAGGMGANPVASARAALPALRETATRFQGTEAGATAQLYVGHALLRTGDAKGAEGTYQAALAVATHDLGRDAARLGLGYARLAQGNAAGAVEVWRPLAERTGPYKGLAALELARAYEVLGKPEEARKFYAEGTASVRGTRPPGSSRTVTLAEERLAALGGAPAPAAGASPAAR